MNNTLSEYTESEFVAMLQRIISHDGTEPEGTSWGSFLKRWASTLLGLI